MFEIPEISVRQISKCKVAWIEENGRKFTKIEKY